MIHIAIGTKAQLIKMAPVMHELVRRNMGFNFIDLGQHALITAELRKEFELKDPDVRLSQGGNISGLWQGILWLLSFVIKGLNGRWVKKEIFRDRPGVCLTHGDTVSTLLALYFAKRAGIKTVHVESGLRSFNCFEPFPEEIIRMACMKCSDVLFVASPWARDNVAKMRVRGQVVLISGNTSVETTAYSLQKRSDPGSLPAKQFVLVTVHRMENIFSRKRLRAVVDLMELISREFAIVFVQHPPTITQLKKYGLEPRLKALANVHTFQILSHAHFIGLLDRSEFIVTDGGSVQEETFYLGKPCLLLRRNTERMEGMGINVVLSDFNNAQMESFVKNYKKYAHENSFSRQITPSREIVDWLERSGREYENGFAFETS